MLATWIAVSVGAGRLGAQEKIALKPRYAPGEYELKQVTSSQVQTTILGQRAEQDVSRTMVMDLTVQPPDEKGVWRMDMAFRQIVQKITAGGKTVLEYDSQSPAAAKPGELVAVFKPLLSAKITFAVAGDGAIQDLTGLEGLWDPAAKEDPNLAALAEQTRKQMGNSLIEGTISQAAKAFPSKPVAVGEGWKTQARMTVAAVGEINVTRDCRLAAVEASAGRKLAVLEVVARAKIDKPRETRMGPARLTVDKFDTVQNGQVKVDAETGLAVRQTWDGTVNSQVTMHSPDGQTVTTTTRQKNKMETTIVPRKPAPATRRGAESIPGTGIGPPRASVVERADRPTQRTVQLSAP